MKKHKVLILGGHGYIGNALISYLQSEGNYTIASFDNNSRERLVKEVGSDSLVEPKYHELVKTGDVTEYCDVISWLKHFQPDTIIHLAEQPSAPYSMKSIENASYTQKNNILGTMNVLWAIRESGIDCHLIKLGSMGVYGTPNEKIFEVNGPTKYDPGSFYHISKACDSLNIRKACEWWKIRATDIHQGIVYGHYEGTRFDYDQYFGTVINRFVAQGAINMLLTIYGSGNQIRGFIHIEDTLKCLKIAIDNANFDGYRVFNQLSQTLSILDIARKISSVLNGSIQFINDPRIEAQSHIYNIETQRLYNLGFEPVYFDEMIEKHCEFVMKHKNRIKKEIIIPTTKWGYENKK